LVLWTCRRKDSSQFLLDLKHIVVTILIRAECWILVKLEIGDIQTWSSFALLKYGTLLWSVAELVAWQDYFRAGKSIAITQFREHIPYRPLTSIHRHELLPGCQICSPG
jgi:hypothetical protein